MIEQRKLTEEEFNSLIDGASYSEKRWIVAVCSSIEKSPLKMFNDHATVWDGALDSGVPIYVAGIFINKGIPEFWTIVNKDVKSQFSLFKLAKRGVNNWVQMFPFINATMMKSWDKNITWTERLGFKKISETEDTITFRITREQ